MKTHEGGKWALLAAMALFFAYLGRINFHHRFMGVFPLILMGAVAAMIFLFLLLNRKTGRGDS